MIAFNVNDMTCGHCVSVITKAVKSVDPDAIVRIDLDTHRVEIASGKAVATVLSNAISEAGYTPAIVADAPSTPGSSSAPKRSGCCCR